MTDHLSKYREAASYFDPWSVSFPKRDAFIDSMIAKFVPNKKVVETGSRSGLFCYSSYYHGCDYVVGVEFVNDLVVGSRNSFEKMCVPKSKYEFVHTRAEHFDYSGFDFVLCIGLLYNIPDDLKHKVLERLKKVPLFLVEIWCVEDENPEPHTTVFTSIFKGCPYPQYKPNKIQAENFLKQHHFSFQEVTPKEFDSNRLHVHIDRYWLCTPMIPML